jgi:MFS family permease
VKSWTSRCHLARVACEPIDQAQLARPTLSYTGLVVSLVVAAQTAVVSAVAPNEIGKASGSFNMLRFLGGVFGVAIGAAVFAAFGGYGSPQAFSTGFVAAMGVCAALALVGAIVSTLLPDRHTMALMRTKAKAPEIREKIPEGEGHVA